MKRLVIHVTDDDIRYGLPCNYRLCPIAEAISREIRGSVNIEVCLDTTGFDIKDGDGWAHMQAGNTRSMQRFINLFDTNKPVKPFNFCLKYSRSDYSD